ncbi:MAG: hypothetical protein RIS70_2621 [Planctomycetota bacterium]
MDGVDSIVAEFFEWRSTERLEVSQGAFLVESKGDAIGALELHAADSRLCAGPLLQVGVTFRQMPTEEFDGVVLRDAHTQANHHGNGQGQHEQFSQG